MIEKRKKKDKILHIISNDKFTIRYINFMKMYMKEYKHLFVIVKGNFEPKVSKSDIVIIDTYKQLILNSKVRKNIYTCRKIIISGMYYKVGSIMQLYSRTIWNKIYLQFWGADFYRYRLITNHDKKIIKEKRIVNNCIKKCAAVLNLIEEDFYELKKIFPVADKHFCAPMPADPKKEIDYTKYREQNNDNEVCRILVGNSATKENRHLQVFQMLSMLKNENIEICCPLSYGDNKYKKQVISEGKRYFGDKFKPLKEFLEIEEYVEFLSTCDVGIFNNNRQQAMGNITLLAGIGKKIYLCSDTSMWKFFKKSGLCIYDIEDLKKSQLKDIVEYKKEAKIQNTVIFDDCTNKVIKAWEKVLSL